MDSLTEDSRALARRAHTQQKVLDEAVIAQEDLTASVKSARKVGEAASASAMAPIRVRRDSRYEGWGGRQRRGRNGSIEGEGDRGEGAGGGGRARIGKGGAREAGLELCMRVVGVTSLQLRAPSRGDRRDF